ncbi:MAG TPA: type II secretion system protein [Longimicrobium sp.]|nr:type II secretion system protein [Longimicrobium sp.]
MRCGWTGGPARRGRVRDQRGFTLLEAMLALVIVGVALVPLLRSIGTGVREQGRLRAHLDAVALAESRMSELALVPPDSIRAWARPRQGWFPEPFQGYRWSAVLRQDERSAALVRGAVVVRWKDGEYSLETVFHRTDLLPQFAPAQ